MFFNLASGVYSEVSSRKVNPFSFNSSTAAAGGAQAGAVSGKIDVSKLTKKDMAELRRRALNGERITFT